MCVKVGVHYSSSGSSQSCVLSPPDYFLCTINDDSVVVSLRSSDEPEIALCRGRIHSLVRTILLLHIYVSRSKEKEIVFRKGPTIIPPVMINGCWACAAVQISWHCSGWQAVLRLKGFIKANLQTRHWTRLYKLRALNKAQLILAGLSLFASDTFSGCRTNRHKNSILPF